MFADVLDCGGSVGHFSASNAPSARARTRALLCSARTEGRPARDAHPGIRPRLTHWSMVHPAC
jgi:hypothetical protein